MLFGAFGENPHYGHVVEDPNHGENGCFNVNIKQLVHFSETFIQNVI